jgi:hypothetical protein
VGVVLGDESPKSTDLFLRTLLHWVIGLSCHVNIKVLRYK